MEYEIRLTRAEEREIDKQLGPDFKKKMNEFAEKLSDLVMEFPMAQGHSKYAQYLQQPFYRMSDTMTFPTMLEDVVLPALSAPPHTGKWKNGKKYEYEYAYCSECGRMQWAGWDSHNQAEENIEAFADDYRFCPGCGAKMKGGVYVK